MGSSPNTPPVAWSRWGPGAPRCPSTRSRGSFPPAKAAAPPEAAGPAAPTFRAQMPSTSRGYTQLLRGQAGPEPGDSSPGQPTPAPWPQFPQLLSSGEDEALRRRWACVCRWTYTYLGLGPLTWQVTLGAGCGVDRGLDSTSPLQAHPPAQGREGVVSPAAFGGGGQALTSFVSGVLLLPLPARECCDPPCAVTPGGRAHVSEARGRSYQLTTFASRSPPSVARWEGRGVPEPPTAFEVGRQWDEGLCCPGTLW